MNPLSNVFKIVLSVLVFVVLVLLLIATIQWIETNLLNSKDKTSINCTQETEMLDFTLEFVNYLEDEHGLNITKLMNEDFVRYKTEQIIQENK